MGIIDLIDPELRDVYLQLPILEDPTVDPAGARASTLELLATFADAQAPSSRVERVDAAAHSPGGFASVPVRIYRPRAAGRRVLPAILFVHAGGFVVGSREISDSYCDHLVEAVDTVVVSVEYRLAPEHPFPAAPEDCYAALVWLFAAADELGIDRTRIAIAGESAGAGIAASVAQMTRDRGEVELCFQMLLWACLDDRHTTRSSQEIHDARLWNRALSESCWRVYLGNRAPSETPIYAVPARAGSLERLPPAYISVGQVDMLLDENVAYAMRLVEAGVRTELHVYPGGFHGFEILAPAAALSIDSRADQERALRRALHP
jgi:acetyl esterase/lipase